jgi:hypothetical protein
MGTLAANKVRTYEASAVDEFNDLPVKADDIIYEGAAITLSSGLVAPLATTNGFYGFADKKCDNAGGGASAKNVRIRTRGYIVLAVTGVTAVTDVGTSVYAHDEDDFTLTAGSDLTIGKIVRWISGTSCVVYFEALPLRSL